MKGKLMYQAVDTKNDAQMVSLGLRYPILVINRPINQKSEVVY